MMETAGNPARISAGRRPIYSTRQVRLLFYLLSGSRRFAALFILVWIGNWYLLSGPFLESILWPDLAPWPGALEYGFLIAPGLCLWLTARRLAGRLRRLGADLPTLRPFPGDKRSIERWALALEAFAAFPDTRAVRGLYRWMANRLRRTRSDKLYAMEELESLILSHRRTWAQAIVLVAVPTMTLTSPFSANRVAALLVPPQGRTALAAVRVCSDIRPSCVTPVVDASPGRHVELHADVDPVGRLDLTLSVYPRTRPIVRIWSTDGASRVRFGYGDSSRELEGHRTIYGQRLSVWYNFEPTRMATVLAVDVYTFEGTHLERTLVKLRNNISSGPGAWPQGGL